jgi:periplasmic protein CpxP/Spy
MFSMRKLPALFTPAVLVVALAAAHGSALAADEGSDAGGPGGPGRHMMAGGHGGHGGMMAGRGLERMLDLVNATAAQRTQIQAIATAARTDLKAIHDSGAALRTQERTVWSATTVDANAVEALRRQKMALHERASQRMTQMRLDISRVLTPEQRKLLADRMAQRQAMAERHRAERATLDGTAGRR